MSPSVIPFSGRRCSIRPTERPANTLGIIQLTLGWVTEQLVRSDNEAVSFQPYRMCEFFGNRDIRIVRIGMVEFDELVEATFGVRRTLLDIEDLVWCGMRFRGP